MRIVCIGFLAATVLTLGIAQQEPRVETPDTSIITHFDLSGPELSVRVPTILFPQSSDIITHLPGAAPLNIRSGLGLQSMSYLFTTEEPPAILSTLHWAPKRPDGLKTVRVVLGVAQAAGAAYALYEHLRRYRHRY